MKIALLLTIVKFFKIVWTCEWKEDREIRWNSSVESWLQFHVRYCGRYCIEDKLTINGDNETTTPCFQCDCEPGCKIYDTCCPLLLNNSYFEPSLHTIHHLPRPDRFQCKTILNNSSISDYYIITDCDPTFVSTSNIVSNSYAKAKALCPNPNTRTLDDITPYSDIYYGIVFANKFCAMCNGYVINDSTTDDTYNLTVKIASPWIIKISCKHYQSLYHLTNEFEFFFAAANSSLCSITLNPPPSKIPPKVCTERLDKNLKHFCTHQDSVEDQMCRTLPRRKYLQAGQMANIFCFLCNGSIKQSCTVDTSRMPWRSFITYSETPPITLLMTIQKRHFKIVNTCDSPRHWQNHKVVCLNRLHLCG
ncbi:hypothetical protein BgiMline_003575 [Biomphalaria glabrata]|nr:hypothetical protein BgiMline_012113 [Biomphalaria glabrata]